MGRMLSVQEAASRLGVGGARVRALIGQGRLPARRVGRAFVLDSAAVAAFARSERAGGRPVSAGNAWALLALLSGVGEQDVAPRSRQRLRALLRHGADGVVRALLHSQRRSEPHAWRVLPIDLDRLVDDPLLVPSGLGAGHELIDISYDPQRDGLDAYVSAESLQALERRVRPSIGSDAANLVLRVPAGASWILGEEVAPLAVAAADLLSHRDERARRTGEKALRRMLDGH